MSPLSCDKSDFAIWYAISQITILQNLFSLRLTAMGVDALCDMRHAIAFRMSAYYLSSNSAWLKLRCEKILGVF